MREIASVLAGILLAELLSDLVSRVDCVIAILPLNGSLRVATVLLAFLRLSMELYRTKQIGAAKRRYPPERAVSISKV